MIETIAAIYLFGVGATLATGMAFHSMEAGRNYVKGLILMSVLWPYVMYRAVRA